MRTLTRILAFAATLLVAAPALADCYLNGQVVPEGTTIAGLTCVNGQWVGG